LWRSLGSSPRAGLRETDADTTAAVARRHGVSEQTIYTWRSGLGRSQPNDVRRLRQLENARLKKPVVERDLEIEVMKEIAVKTGERAGPPRRGIVCDRSGPVAAAGLHADRGGPLGARLSLADGGEGRGGARADGETCRAVSALQLLPDRDLSAP